MFCCRCCDEFTFVLLNWFRFTYSPPSPPHDFIADCLVTCNRRNICATSLSWQARAAMTSLKVGWCSSVALIKIIFPGTVFVTVTHKKNNSVIVLGSDLTFDHKIQTSCSFDFACFIYNQISYIRFVHQYLLRAAADDASRAEASSPAASTCTAAAQAPTESSGK